MTALGTRARAMIAAVILLAAVLVLAAVRPVTAAWNDSEHANAAMTASTLAPPVRGTCSVAFLGGSTTFTWANPTGGAPRTGYVYGVYAVGGTSPIIPETTTTGNTATLTWNAAFSTSTTYEIRVRAANNSWQSAATVGTFTTGVFLSFSSCSW